MAIQKGSLIRRNDRCVCGSGRKYKHCCSPSAPHGSTPPARPAPYIDTGERPVRWVIIDRTGTQFFADKDNRALVFSSYADAAEITRLEEFSDSEPGDINVAGVGAAKFDLLREKIPYVEVSDVAAAALLVRERIDYGHAGELLPDEPTDLFSAE